MLTLRKASDMVRTSFNRPILLNGLNQLSFMNPISPLSQIPLVSSTPCYEVRDKAEFLADLINVNSTRDPTKIGNVKRAEDLTISGSKHTKAKDTEKDPQELWNKEKIACLLKWAKECRFDWKKIARRFKHPKITPFRVKNKYKALTEENFIEPRTQFTHKEDLMLAKFFNMYGKNWSQIAEHFDKRKAVTIKNRYYTKIKKRNLLEGLVTKVTKLEEHFKLPIEDIAPADCEIEIQK